MKVRDVQHPMLPETTAEEQSRQRAAGLREESAFILLFPCPAVSEYTSRPKFQPSNSPISSRAIVMSHRDAAVPSRAFAVVFHVRTALGRVPPILASPQTDVATSRAVVFQVLEGPRR